MSRCPHCDAELEIGVEECPYCGIVLAKARSPLARRRPAPRPAPLPPADRKQGSENPSTVRALLLPGLFIALTLAALALQLGRTGSDAAPAQAPRLVAEEAAPAAPFPSAPALPAPVALPAAEPSAGSRGDEAIQELLDRQAAALVDQDSDVFLETFQEERQEAARFLFEQLQRLPIAGYRLEAIRDAADQLRLQQWIELEGMREHPFYFTRPIQVSRGEDGLRLAQFGRADYFALWDHEPVEVTRTNHFLVFTHPSRQAIRSEVVSVIESAWLTLYQRYLPMAERYVAFVPGDPAYFGWMSQDTLIAGVASWRYLDETSADPQVLNPALFLNPVLFQRGVDPDLRLQALQHEMVHLALSDRTHKMTPSWLIEGSAVYFSGGSTQGGEIASLGKVLDRMTLDHGRTLATTEEYAYAGAAVEYLVDSKGVEHFLAFYERVAHLRGQQEKALQELYGISTASLDRDLKEWLVAMHRFRS